MFKRFTFPTAGQRILMLQPACDSSVVNQLSRSLQNRIVDPIDTTPYPIHIGGDGGGYFYATILADVSVRDDGGKYSVVIPGLLAPCSVKELARFKANGLAGQARVIGNRAAWVNADREIVIAPLDNRDRNAFKPF